MIEHLAAVRALLVAGGFVDVLNGGTGPGWALYDGQVPGEPALPYGVLWAGMGVPTSTSLVDEKSMIDGPFYVTGVGATAAAAQLVLQRSRDALLDVRPVVAGWDTQKLGISYSQPIQEDKNVRLTGSGRHPMYGMDAWRIVAVPA